MTHDEKPVTRMTAGELVERLKKLPPMDVERWRRERAEDDEIFGPDYPEDPWERCDCRTA